MGFWGGLNRGRRGGVDLGGERECWWDWCRLCLCEVCSGIVVGQDVLILMNSDRLVGKWLIIRSCKYNCV